MRPRRATTTTARVAVLAAVSAGLLVLPWAGGAAEPTVVPQPDVPGTAVAPAPESSATPAERVTLPEALRRALARNPTVAVALAEVERAEGLVREARAGWWPTLVGNGAYTRLDHDRVFGGRVITEANQLSGSLLLTVPLVAPQGWTGAQHARDARRVAEASAGDVRRLVAQATANAYLAVLAQHRQIRAIEASRANARSHAEYAHTRLAGGIGHSIDDVRAQQDLATVEVQLQSIYTGLARAREALGVLVGAEGPLDSVDDVDLGALPTLSDALEGARAKRPDVGAQRTKLAAAETLRKDVWAYYGPYLAAVGQPFVQRGVPQQPTAGWQAQLLLTLPLYDGGARDGVARERDALLLEARQGLEATLRQAQSEVRVAFEAMLRADQALVSAHDAARLSKRAYELATLAYRAGATTNLEVIDAARRVRDADGDASQAEDVARRARLDLLVSSGRFP
jgi:outer membrane protein TolC